MFVFKTSENANINPIDKLIRDTIITVQNNFFDICEQKFVDTNKFTRNQKELPNDSQSNNSSQSNSKSNKSNYLLNITHNSCKPDALYYDCFNTLVLVGEEKRESLISAKNDLDKKIGKNLDPIYLTYPFTFEYAQGGQYLDLYARDKTRKAHLIENFVLTTFIGRLRLVIRMINITRVFAGYLKLKRNTESHIGLFHTVFESNVTYLATCVQKIVFDDLRFDFLINLYDTLSKKNVKNTIKCLNHKIVDGPITRSKAVSKFLKLELSPICQKSEKYVETIEGLMQMSENILMALFDIHECDFVHRDIRLPNILYDPNLKKFLLNDFEYAGKNNYILDLDLRAHNGVIKKKQKYHKIHDIICFGNLINKEYNKIVQDQNTKYENFLSKFKIVKNLLDQDYDSKYGEFKNEIQIILKEFYSREC
jgi:serine/threonine protein kinase